MPKETKELSITEMKAEIDTKLQDQQTLQSLMTITFNGLQPAVAKQAMLEAMMRGFTFKDFLEKNVYAIPFSGKYSLVTSIDYIRKIGMRSGVCGKSAPEFEEDEHKRIVSCTITIKKIIGSHIGEFSATAFMSEYNTGRNLWVTKPRTMIAKVAEMHALRAACPEELSQSYLEEEVAVLPAEPREAVVTNINKVEEKPKPNFEKIEYLESMLPIAGKTVEALLTHTKKNSLEEFTETELDSWIAKFEKEVEVALSKVEVPVVEEAVIEDTIEEMPEETKPDATPEDVINTFGGKVVHTSDENAVTTKAETPAQMKMRLAKAKLKK